MVAALAIIGAAIGMAGGIANSFAKQSEYDNTLFELKTKRDMLDQQYSLKKEQINAVAGENVAELETNIADANITRGANLSSSATNMVDQQRIANMQIAQLQVEAAEAKGAAVQDVAMSGTRLMTDENGNVINSGVFNTSRRAARAEEQAKAQAQINMRQSFASATANYTDATMRMQSYRRQIASTRSQLERDLASLDLNYNQQRYELSSDIEYMESDAGERQLRLSIISSILGGTMNGASSGLKLYSTGKEYGLWDNN